MSTLRSFLVAASLAAATLSSTVARADDDAPVYRPGAAVPAGYHVERSEVGETLAIGGAATLAIAYVPMLALGVLGGVACSAGYCDPNPAWFAVPVVGPFKAAHEAGSSTAASLWQMDGVLQAAGAGVLLIGAVTYLAGSEHLVRNASPRARVRVVPLVAGGVSGLALGGTF